MRGYPLTTAARYVLTAVSLLSSTLPGSAQDQGGVEIEYIAHACFRLHSPGGTTVLIDPFASRVWLGFDFPADIGADAVLITHPHYDHDAGEWMGRKPTWPEGAAIYREPGEAMIGDGFVRGIRGKHADPWGKEFGQLNTIWLIEIGGVVLAHLGDNGPLTEEVVAELGQVDVLLTPLDDHDHILKRTEVRAIRDALQPSVVIPMHYRHPELEQPGKPKDLGEIEPCLAGESHVRRIEGNRVRISRDTLPDDETVFVFRPSPLLWPSTAAPQPLRRLHVAGLELLEHLRTLERTRERCAAANEAGRRAGWAKELAGASDGGRDLAWLRAATAMSLPGQAARLEPDEPEVAHFAWLASAELPPAASELRSLCASFVHDLDRARASTLRAQSAQAAYDAWRDDLRDVGIETPEPGAESWAGEVRARVGTGETVEVFLISGRPQESAVRGDVEARACAVQLAPERGTWQGVAIVGKDRRGRAVSASPVVWVRGSE